MKACLLCRLPRVQKLLNFGPQTLSNRFVTERMEEEAVFDLALGQCYGCGMIQLMAPVSAVILKPPVEWISYREAEGHLDELVDEIGRLPGLCMTAVIGGITTKDDSTIARMHNAGFARTWRIDIERDLHVDAAGAGPETVQHYLTPERAVAIARRRGQADVLIARHILEHAQNPARFLSAIRRLVKPTGYIVFEVPDCSPALCRMDYTMPWEEHVMYFTRELLELAVDIWQLTPISFRLYRYSQENSLVAIVASGPATMPDSSSIASARTILNVGEKYAAAFPEYRCSVHAKLSEYGSQSWPIALFGAGHLSSAWLNFLGVAQYIEFVADDDPRKQGLLMSGSRVPIRSSALLVQRGVKLCLLSLNQESEAKVIDANRSFIRQGGTFASIFPQRPNSLV